LHKAPKGSRNSISYIELAQKKTLENPKKAVRKKTKKPRKQRKKREYRPATRLPLIGFNLALNAVSWLVLMGFMGN